MSKEHIESKQNKHTEDVWKQVKQFDYLSLIKQCTDNERDRIIKNLKRRRLIG